MIRSVSLMSSMATRHILAALASLYEAQIGCEVVLTSIGGVDAAKRIQAGEPIDLAVLARDALDKLARDGFVWLHIHDFAKSPTAIALPESSQVPEVCDEAAIRKLLATTRSVGVSTGPSGRAVRSLLQKWCIGEPRVNIAEAAPGVPVARLVAAGEADIGFQQMSELLGEPGIKVFGPVPDHVLPATVFAMAVCRRAVNSPDAESLMRYLSSAEAAAAKLRGGMQPI